MDRSGDTAPRALPIACTLGPDHGVARLDRWRAVSERAHPGSRRAGHLLEVRSQAQLGVREELERLAAAERQCCSFLVWEVSAGEDRVLLRVQAAAERPDEIAAVAEPFGAV
jgi:hypothetical protein